MLAVSGEIVVRDVEGNTVGYNESLKRIEDEHNVVADALGGYFPVVDDISYGGQGCSYGGIFVFLVLLETNGGFLSFWVFLVVFFVARDLVCVSGCL